MKQAEMPRFIAYLRVSTAKQGQSGLGLEAQRDTVAKYVASVQGVVLHELVEVESGKKADRPKLAQAMHLAEVTGAKLIIAKLDRLSRNVAFIAKLQESGVPFVCCDMPDANNLTVHILAAIAQHEREMISKRTKEALAAAKRRGVKLGNPNGAANLRGKGNRAAVREIQGSARAFAAKLRPVVDDIKAGGITSRRGIAFELQRRGIKSRRGGAWTATAVRNLEAQGAE